MTENEEKRLEKMRQKMAQIKAQERAIIARDKTRQRKERTRRLIEYGTLVEKYLHYDWINAQAFEELLSGISALPESRLKELFLKAKNR